MINFNKYRSKIELQKKLQWFESGFRVNLKRLIKTDKSCALYESMFVFEKKFYRTILIDRDFLKSIILSPFNVLINFYDLDVYKRHKLFFLLLLDDSVLNDPHLNADFIKNTKNLPLELKNHKLKYIKELIKSRFLKIFNYKSFSLIKRNHMYRDQIWNAYNFIRNYLPSCCPYCNLAILENVNINIGKNIMFKTRPPIDHFLSQQLYPFFSMSFFNLVPSCYVCNSVYKGSKDFRIPERVNPTEDSFHNNSRFELRIKDKNATLEQIQSYYNNGEINVDAFKIGFSSPENADLLNVKEFGLIDRYEARKNDFRGFIAKLPRANQANMLVYAKMFNLSFDVALSEFLEMNIDPSKDKDFSLSILKRNLYDYFSSK